MPSLVPQVEKKLKASFAEQLGKISDLLKKIVLNQKGLSTRLGTAESRIFSRNGGK